MADAEDSPLLVLLGPTASGKTALSLHLANRFSGEIVSCDSVAVYREMEIGTAKPTVDERREIPHHLIDVADPSESFTAGEYSRQARMALADITSRKKLPIVTGGTGLYLRALIDGLSPAPQRSEEMRERLRSGADTKGAGWLHRILTRLDPAAAEQIHPNDTPKLVRAIEVCLSAGQPMTEAWRVAGREALKGYRVLRIGLDPDRKALYARINARAAAMFDAGLIEETRQLATKYGEARPLTSLGYKQAMAVIHGEMSLAEAVTSAQQGHRNYAKRQMTWFRREPDVHWLRGFGDEAEIRDEAERVLDGHLKAAIRAR